MTLRKWKQGDWKGPKYISLFTERQIWLVLAEKWNERKQFEKARRKSSLKNCPWWRWIVKNTGSHKIWNYSVLRLNNLCDSLRFAIYNFKIFTFASPLEWRIIARSLTWSEPRDFIFISLFAYKSVRVAVALNLTHHLTYGLHVTFRGVFHFTCESDVHGWRCLYNRIFSIVCRNIGFWLKEGGQAEAEKRRASRRRRWWRIQMMARRQREPRLFGR